MLGSHNICEQHVPRGAAHLSVFSSLGITHTGRNVITNLSMQGRIDYTSRIYVFEDRRSTALQEVRGAKCYVGVKQ